MQVSFYQITQGTIEQTLFKLLSKIYSLGKRVVVVADSEERVEHLNISLWTQGHGSFLPHGSMRDDAAADQPIWLTSFYENPNQASVLVSLYSTFSVERIEQENGVERELVLFVPSDTTQYQAAQQAWRHAEERRWTTTLWLQTPTGWLQDEAGLTISK